MWTLRMLSLGALLSAGAIAVAQPQPRLANFQMFPSSTGVNSIAGVTGDGRDGLIVSGWRDNGNAHGFNVFLLLIPATPGGQDFNAVVFGSEAGWVAGEGATTISDQPHTGEDYVRSVRFDRADLNGRPETVAFIANRQIVDGYPLPAITQIQIMTLRDRGDEPLGPLYYFELLSSYRTTRRYCNSDAALRTELGVPLPPNYQGADSADGCL